MRIVSILLLFAAIWGLSGCGDFMIGGAFGKPVERGTKPEPGGFFNSEGNKYQIGIIDIKTKPEGLEVELYNRGDYIESMQDYLNKAGLSQYEEFANSQEYRDRLKQQGSLREQYADCARLRNGRYRYDTNGNPIWEAEELCKKRVQATEDTNMDKNMLGAYQFENMQNKFPGIQGLLKNTTPTKARIVARTADNKASKYLLVFKKDGKEVARREFKAHINWWVYAGNAVLVPAYGAGILTFPIEMGWFNGDNSKRPHEKTNRSYLTQGDIEIDLTKEVEALGK